MATSHGKFVWYELMTTDTQAATKFYGTVAGWTAADPGMPGMQYTILSAGSTAVGGIMAVPDGAEFPPHWIGYVYVDNVDEATARIIAEGGAIHRPASDIPGVGRFAVVADPQGAAFIVFKPDPEPATVPAPPEPGTPGNIGWNELLAADMPTAFPFYAKLFGWTKGEAHDMGPMGTYQIFTANGSVGGMMTKPPFIPTPVWRYYINVDNIDTAADRVTSNGGTIVHGPQQVPGGIWIINAQDPQGAHFSLVGPKV
jgi:predicted enzyme related to lactoylglutathione lyase